MQRDSKKEKGGVREIELEKIDIESPSTTKSHVFHQQNGEIIEQNEDVYFGGPNLEVWIFLFGKT